MSFLKTPKLVDRSMGAAATKVVEILQNTTDGLQAPDDSGLTNLWDEICVQVQQEYSVFWDSYECIIEQACHETVNMLPIEEQAAIWLHTSEERDVGRNYKSPQAKSNDVFGHICIADIGAEIKKCVLRLAADCNSSYVKSYLNPVENLQADQQFSKEVNRIVAENRKLNNC